MSQAVEGPKRVLIVCELDGYANGQKPVEIERFLRSRATMCGWPTPCSWAARLISPALCCESSLRWVADGLACIWSSSRRCCSLVAGSLGGAISRTTWFARSCG